MLDQEIRARIVEAAKDYYFNNGFSKSSMDDFAQILGMSKKTIYKYFSSKDDIVRAIVYEKITRVHGECVRLQNTKEIDFLERTRCVTRFLSNEMSLIKPAFYFDLKKNLPDVWKEVDEFRNARIHEDFKKFILEGIQLGVLRNDINVDVLVLMYSNAIQTIISPETLINLPLNSAQAYDAIVNIIFGGVFTQQGKEKYMNGQIVSTKEKEFIAQ